MCAGMIVQFRIGRIVIGESANFKGCVDFLRRHKVEVMELNDSDCKALMKKFIREKQNSGMRILPEKSNVTQ